MRRTRPRILRTSGGDVAQPPPWTLEALLGLNRAFPVPSLLQKVYPKTGLLVALTFEFGCVAHQDARRALGVEANL
jgi:hypothetical protein